MQNATNRWRLRLLNKIAENDAISLSVDGEDRTNFKFCRMTARVAFDTFIRFVTDLDQTNFVIMVARAKAWIMSFIEDFQSRLKLVAWGGREPHVLRSRYNSLLTVAIASLQAEFLTCLHRTWTTEGRSCRQAGTVTANVQSHKTGGCVAERRMALWSRRISSYSPALLLRHTPHCRYTVIVSTSRSGDGHERRELKQRQLKYDGI